MAEMMKRPTIPTYGLQTQPAPIAEKPSHFMPYDAREFARHIYGFARACVVSAQAFGELRARFNRVRLKEGDILIAEPKAFGGAVRTLPYNAGLSREGYKSITDDLQSRLQCYSKHKPYTFGDVLFVDDARQLLRERELEALRASIHREKDDELQGLLNLLEQERATSAEQARHINELRAQMREEHSRGVESERQRAEQLDALLTEAKAEIATLKANIEHMRQSFGEFSDKRAIVERMQSVQAMPQTNEDVVSWFRLFFADRIDFTERGLKTAIKCDVNPEMLWDCLYKVARILVDLYREGVLDIENAYKQRTGWELAPTEGAMTRKNADYMNLRRDTYDGREISIEPHIKFPKSARRTGAQYQRLHYAYDSISRKVIVGYVGDHLENFLSQSVH